MFTRSPSLRLCCRGEASNVAVIRRLQQDTQTLGAGAMFAKGRCMNRFVCLIAVTAGCVEPEYHLADLEEIELHVAAMHFLTETAEPTDPFYVQLRIGH